MILKRCSKCGIEKPLDDFSNNKNHKDGKHNQCKLCIKEYQQSDKGKIAVNKASKKYSETEVGYKSHLKAVNKYHKTDKGKSIVNKSIKKYHQSDNGKMSISKTQSKRKRDMGFIPLNEYQLNHAGHHINKDYVIYIPYNIHNSIYHNHKLPETMVDINNYAFEYLKGCKKTKHYQKYINNVK